MTLIFGNTLNKSVTLAIAAVMLCIMLAGCATQEPEVRYIATTCPTYSEQILFDRPVYAEKQTDSEKYRVTLAYMRFIEELKGVVKLYEAQVKSFNGTLAGSVDAVAQE